MKNLKAKSLGTVNIRALFKNKKIIEEKTNNNTGITLIALVITIIVLLILAGVSIAILAGQNGILTQAQKAKMTTELSSYKEQLELYKTEKLSENREFLENTLTVGKENLKYNTQPEGETGNIKTVIPNIKDEYIDKIEIIKGALLINTQDSNEVEIAKSLGIAANPYDIVNGELLSSNGNLLLMDESGTLVIPDSVTKIGAGAFANLDGLKTIIIPGTVKEIGVDAFSYNKTLETVIIQEGVEIISNRSFSHCGKLKTVQMPESLTSIGQSAFYCCSSLTAVEIPSKITTIPRMAFSLCDNLSQINFKGDNLTTLGSEAFWGANITSIDIPKNVSEISETTFSKCRNLVSFTIAASNNNFIYESGMLMTSDKTRVLFLSEKLLKNMTSFTIPDGVVNFITDISNLTNIKQLTIPASVETLYTRLLPTSIENIIIDNDNTKLKVAENCIYSKDGSTILYCFSKEKNIVLKSTATILETFAFTGANNAESITLPDTLTTIHLASIYGSYKLKEVNIGANVSSISSLFEQYSNYAFTLNIDKSNPYYIVENNVLYTKNRDTLVSVLYKINGTFTVPSTVKTISAGAFDSQSNLTAINLNDGLEKLENRIFAGCSKITSINIPSSVTSILGQTFSGMNNLSSININKPENSISGAPWGAPKGMKVVNWNT